jgi:hypothetical protein
LESTLTSSGKLFQPTHNAGEEGSWARARGGHHDVAWIEQARIAS